MHIRDRIMAAQAANPGITAPELATALGVSRQRIYQALARHELRIAKRARSPKRRQPPQQERTGGVATVSSRSVGKLGEYLAAVDLLSRGYQVYAPMIDHRKYDLIACGPDSRLTTVEVRSAKRKGGQLIFSRKSIDQADVYALVVHGEPVQYRPESIIGTHAIGGSVSAHELSVALEE